MFKPEILVDAAMAETLVVRHGCPTAPIMTSLLLHRKAFKYFVQELPEHGEIFGLGCGYGRYTVPRLDMSSCFWQDAARTFVPRSFLDLGLESNSVAGLWCCHSFMHTPSYVMPRVLAEIKRVLVPGGLLGIIMPSSPVHEHEIDRLEYKNNDPGSDPHLWHWKPHPNTLARLCAATGLEGLYLGYQDEGDEKVLFQMFEKI
jgi:SAM-dependent methyltransferase